MNCGISLLEKCISQVQPFTQNSKSHEVNEARRLIVAPSRPNLYLLRSAALLMAMTVAFLPRLSQAFPLPFHSPDLETPAGLHRSKLGFSIHSKNTEWEQHKPVKADASLEVFFQPKNKPANAKALLTVRSHLLLKTTTVREYMLHWRKHYPRLGFRILEGRKVRVQDKIGYLIDMIHPDQKKQLRQVIFVNERVAVTLTCQDLKEHFTETLRPCNQIVRNFTWTQNLH